MTEFVFSNFARGKLLERIEANETSIFLSYEAVTKFAQPTGLQVQRCIIRDDSQDPEIIDIVLNDMTGDLLIVRAREGTAAKQWNAGAVVEQFLSAGVLTELEALK